MLHLMKRNGIALLLVLTTGLTFHGACSPKRPERPSLRPGALPGVDETASQGTGKNSNTTGGGAKDQGAGGSTKPGNTGTTNTGNTGSGNNGNDSSTPGNTDTNSGNTNPPVDANVAAKVEVKGRQLFVNGKAFIMRSVAWNPVRKGQTHPEGLSYRNASAQDLTDIDRDLRLIKEMGANTIRTYDVVRDPKVLDLIKKHKLYVIVPAFNYFGTTLDAVKSHVEALKSHPTTLLWELGNEWNYNSLYGNPNGYNGAKDQIKAAAKLIKGLDRTHPMATVYGEIPPKDLVDEMSDIDVWGTNVYSGLSFGDRFQRWKGVSGKPLYVGEYGADAINKTNLDTASQSQAVGTLSKEILNNLSARDGNNALIGGSVFEFSDEWWKDNGGSLSSQEVGGIAPGGGPFPDAVFNEEWWGLVDIERRPRPAYNELKGIWSQIKD